MRKRIAVVVLAAAVVVSAALTGGAAGNIDRGTSAGAARAATASGTLRWGTAAGIPCLDPRKAASILSDIALRPVYDYLIFRDPQQRLHPGLATSWTFAKNGTYLEMTLRRGVKFQDGTPFDATAVQQNINSGKSVPGSLQTLLSIVKGVRVMSPYKVRFIASRAGLGVLPAVLSSYPGAMISPKALSNPDLCTNPVGAGPYRVVSYKPNDRIVYQPFAGYWDKKAAGLQQLELVYIPDDNARLNALLSKQIDGTYVRARQYSSVKNDSRFAIHLGTDLQFNFLVLNTALAPLDDVRVRQAVNYCIDRKEIVDVKQNGLALASVQPWPSWYWAADPKVRASYYGYNLAKAKQLLAAAGYPNGFKMAVTTTGAITEYVDMVQAIQGQLKKCGIDVSITLSQNPFPAWLSGKYHAAWFGWSGSPDPSILVDNLYTSTGFWNAGKKADPTIMSLYAKTLAVTDQAARAKLFRQISNRATQQALEAIVYYPDSIVAVDKCLKGWQKGMTWSYIDFRGLTMKSGC
jgi:peptide/nickel transport system substrate-binding protein